MTVQLFEDATGYLYLNVPATGAVYQLAPGEFLYGEFERHARAILSGIHADKWEGARVTVDIDNEALYKCVAAYTGGKVYQTGGETEETRKYILGENPGEIKEIPFGFYVTVNATGQAGQINLVRYEGSERVYGVRDYKGEYIGTFKTNELSVYPEYQWEEYNRDREEGMF